MLKKFFNRLKKSPDIKKDELKVEKNELVIEEVCATEEENQEDVVILAYEEFEEPLEDKIEECEEMLNQTEEVITEDIMFETNENEYKNQVEVEEDKYVREIKIKRGKGIKAIDVYTEEEVIFKSHKECSRKLKVPIGFIVENLKYGYTDYLGEAINYLSKKLQSNEGNDYLESNKTPIEIFNNLHNKIFTVKMPESKREEILSSEKIEPVKMHYKFECIDEEYDEYFEKYKSIIKRGGKKKIELVDKNGEAIEIFKSLDECANFLGKDKNEIVEMLKYKNNKVGRNEIRYSLRNI